MGTPDRDEAIRLYTVEQLSMRAVGAKLGRSDCWVWLVLCAAGIPRRPKGQRPSGRSPDERLERNREASRRRVARLRAAGLCHDCTSPTNGSGVRCSECAAYHCERVKEWNALKRAA